VPNFDARWQRPDTLQAIFDQISDSVFFYDKNLHLLRVNKSGEQLFDQHAETMLGKPCWELFGFAAGDPHQGSRSMGPPPDGGQSWALPSGIVRLRMEHGRERRVIIRTVELLDQAGDLEVIVAIVTDITERAGSALDPLGQTHAEPVYARAHGSAVKYHPVVVRNRRIAAAVGALFVILLVVLVASKFIGSGSELSGPALAEKEKREAAAWFSALTPAQHIERAKLALRPGATPDAIAEGLRHLKVIPASAPDANRAKALQRELVKAGNLANAQSLIDASSNSDVRDGMEKLQRASVILDGVAGQYPNDKGADQVARAIETAAEQLAIRYPKDFASLETELVDFTWEKGGFGTVMMANFTIRNNSPIDVADFKIHCERDTDAGVVLDDNAGTAYGVVKAHTTKRIPNVNMGFLSEQGGKARTTKTNCEILSLKLAADSQAFGSSR